MDELTPKRFWMGSAPVRCDLTDTNTSADHDLSKEFVDGATRMGPWAIMCARCARMRGVGIGRGMGQRYQRQEDGRWLKVAG